MIKTQKEYDGRWMVWNTNTMETAWIVRIDDWFMGRKQPSQYRVDKEGQTRATLLESFANAKSAAGKLLK